MVGVVGSSGIDESFVVKGDGMCVGEVYRFDGWDWIGDGVSGMPAGSVHNVVVVSDMSVCWAHSVVGLWVELSRLW